MPSEPGKILRIKLIGHASPDYYHYVYAVDDNGNVWQSRVERAEPSKWRLVGHE